MRALWRISLAFLTVVVLSTTVHAQSIPDPRPLAERATLHASVGSSFANVGTTFATIAGLDFPMSDRAAVVGEFGFMPRAPFREASAIAPPMDSPGRRVNAYHWNTNIKVRPYERGPMSTYLTAGVGTFTADVVGDTRQVGSLSFQDRRRVTDAATNLGAGVLYRINHWMGLTADYRTFFVHRNEPDPRVHRFTTGLSLSLR